MAILIEKYKALEMVQRVRQPIGNSDDDPSFARWRSQAAVTLATVFGEDTHFVKEFDRIEWSVKSLYEVPHNVRRDTFKRGMATSQGIMETAELRILAIPDPPPPPTPNPQSPTPPSGPTPETSGPKPLTKRIFVVHGRDDGIKNGVARYVKTLGLEPIVLHEQPNRGQTVIKKFEKEAEAEFAVICATPDDVAGLAETLAEKDEESVPFGDLKKRARQNVIFEAGFFVGRLGRSRFCSYPTAWKFPRTYQVLSIAKGTAGKRSFGRNSGS